MNIWFVTENGDNFNVPDEDFDKIADVFGMRNAYSKEDAVIAYQVAKIKGLSREYSEEEVEAMFEEHAELTGMDKEIQRDSVAPYSDRCKAKDELNVFIKKGKPISKKSAKTIIKVLDAFDEYAPVF